MAQVSPTFSPLYRQIKNLILQGLASGEWRPGESHSRAKRNWLSRFNVSQGTVRKAIDEMAAENLVVRKQGKGTYVASHNDPARLLPLPSRGAELKAASPCRKAYRWSAGAPRPARRPRACSRSARGLRSIIVRRLLRFDGKPVVLDEIYLPGEVFQGLTLEVLQDNQDSLYTLFETRFGVRMIRAEERIRAVAADRAIRRIAGVEEGSPLLSVERVTYTYGDKPVEWRRGLYSTAEHYYLNELN
jgi:GntR family transcriptional regulator